MIETESRFWIRKDDRSPVVDPDVIAAAPGRASPYVSKTSTVPQIVEWVRARTGLTMTKSSLYNLREGKNVTPRTAILTALGEFWRIDPRLLDPTVPASSFPYPDTEASQLDPLEQRTYDLMREVGLTSVRPREVANTFQGSTDADKLQLLGILEAMAQHRKTEHHDKP
ncbi:hypothetical protein [Amycolatopsis sp. H20-H5]|uniref:hypothetical protein n=1 Tax=Amycolatopsis sp. H20-H5 TaxID=3046309 RepID=UPI002DC045AD|nr:hypothetical protein [Amycolatopsis sp. H20-H5]MEC3981990.1 hypothetical protein [Amycolatopsis sp. H20-H5]